jgi:hypothetical protein
MSTREHETPGPRRWRMASRLHYRPPSGKVLICQMLGVMVLCMAAGALRDVHDYLTMYVCYAGCVGIWRQQWFGHW